MVDFGFYHTMDGITTCFVCGLSTGPWELNSDPINIQHENCYWYNIMKNGQSENIQDTNLLLETFKNGWVGVGSISKEKVE